jgi:hypothetical protein
VQYDCIGVGAGVKAEVNRLRDENLVPEGMQFVPWDAGSGPLHPDRHVIPGDQASPLNKDFYGNFKAPSRAVRGAGAGRQCLAGRRKLADAVPGGA